MMTNVASAIFDTPAEANRAVADLRKAGVPDRALSIVTTNDGVTSTADGVGDVTDDGHGSIMRGILGGGALGAGLGVAALAIPASVHWWQQVPSRRPRCLAQWQSARPPVPQPEPQTKRS